MAPRDLTSELSHDRIPFVIGRLTDPLLYRFRGWILSFSLLASGVLILCEHYLQGKVSIGLLYLVPVLFAAPLLPRWMLLLAAIGLAVARESVSADAWDADVWLRFPLAIAGFSVVAFVASELFRSHSSKRELEQRNQLESQLLADTQRDGRALIESSPAAVLTVDSTGNIAMANVLASRLLGFENGSPEGRSIGDYFPILAKLLTHNRPLQRIRTVLEARGRRENGEGFVAQIWVSLYEASSGPRLTAILSDTKEDLFEHEEAGLRQLLGGSRVIAGAVSHEIRNLAAAASIVYGNVSVAPEDRRKASFETLGRVIESIKSLSSQEVNGASERELLDGFDVVELLEELRGIITPLFSNYSLRLEWEIEPDLPKVRANHTNLLQVCLNLVQNARRELHGTPNGRLRVTAFQLTNLVVIRFSDNGPGIEPLKRLFKPVQPGAASRGLGLFISRAIIESFGGQLHHSQRPGECSFIVELPIVDHPEMSD